jgi:Fe-S-cluster containining protein
MLIWATVLGYNEKMSNKRTKTSDYHQPKRLGFKDDEAVHKWLPMLLDAYYIVDKGIAEAVRRESGKGKRLACRKGCSTCCNTHTTIPVYPLELVGISWYVVEKTAGPARGSIKDMLAGYKEGDPCPFLSDGACSVHPMRPVSCRQFMVFGTPCDKGEDPYYTRREDVLTPIRKYTDRAFFLMLPFYGVEGEQERWKIIEAGAVHQVVKLLQSCNWKSLAEKMEEFDRTR